MYGLIGNFVAVAGQRDALVALLLDCTDDMPGCLSYVVATDPKQADTVWITEVWTDEASHKASLALPAVQAAIKQAMPLIASFGEGTQTVPAGGYGLGRSAG